MATVLAYNLLYEGVIVPATLTGTDDAVYVIGNSGAMIVENSTGGDLTINVQGAGATTVRCKGVGDIDLSGGKDFVVTDGTTARLNFVPLNQSWLGDGNLTITGGTGAKAYILYS